MSTAFNNASDAIDVIIDLLLKKIDAVKTFKAKLASFDRELPEYNAETGIDDRRELWDWINIDAPWFESDNAEPSFTGSKYEQETLQQCVKTIHDFGRSRIPGYVTERQIN